jgi:hypothetical protein
MLTPDQDAAAWKLYEEIRTEQRKRRLKDGDVILALCRQVIVDADDLAEKSRNVARLALLPKPMPREAQAR